MAMNGQALFSNAISGLTNTYATLAKSSGGSISLSDLTNTENQKNLSLNQSFLDYLTNNFGTIDKNKDGKIDSKDMDQLCQNIKTKGLTYEEIMQFAYQNGNSSLLDTVTTYFNDIDKNKDGRVTMSEINNFSSESDKQRMEDEYASFDAGGFSVFYGDEGASKVKTKSIISSRYPSSKE